MRINCKGAIAIALIVCLIFAPISPPEAHVVGGWQNNLSWGYAIEFGLDPDFPVAEDGTILQFAYINNTDLTDLFLQECQVNVTHIQSGKMVLSTPVIRTWGDLYIPWVAPYEGDYNMSTKFQDVGFLYNQTPVVGWEFDPVNWGWYHPNATEDEWFYWNSTFRSLKVYEASFPIQVIAPDSEEVKGWGPLEATVKEYRQSTNWNWDTSSYEIWVDWGDLQTSEKGYRVEFEVDPSVPIAKEPVKVKLNLKDSETLEPILAEFHLNITYNGETSGKTLSAPGQVLSIPLSYGTGSFEIIQTFPWTGTYTVTITFVDMEAVRYEIPPPLQEEQKEYQIAPPPDWAEAVREYGWRPEETPPEYETPEELRELWLEEEYLYTSFPFYVEASIGISPGQTGLPLPTCIVATSTYGSELAPEVQLLRGFRDNVTLTTFAGSQFMSVFNAWYYSWSPPVAGFIDQQPAVKTLMQGILYPLIATLNIAMATNSIFNFNSEVGIVVAGLVSSSMIGIIYLSPFMSASFVVAKKNRKSALRFCKLKLFMFSWLASVVLIIVGEASSFQIIMMIGSGAFVLTTLWMSASLVAANVVKALSKVFRFKTKS
ncbi:MAG: CFI-box-CTERM domain-containing protein [Candidatus Bathyarchaeota archaeon]